MKFLIAGGSKGIGGKITEELVHDGHDVYVLSRSEPSSGIHIKGDVLEDIPDLEEIDHLDGFAYCPGSINLKPFQRLKIDDFEQDLQINYLGAVKVLQKVLPKLKKNKAGSVVFFSTVAVGTGMAFHSSISGAKGAIEGLTRSLAAELAPSIRVNAIAPSVVETDLASGLLSNEDRKKNIEDRHPLRRVGETKDIAAMAKFLLAGESTWITGQVITIDGGMGSLK